MSMLSFPKATDRYRSVMPAPCSGASPVQDADKLEQQLAGHIVPPQMGQLMAEHQGQPRHPPKREPDHEVPPSRLSRQARSFVTRSLRLRRHRYLTFCPAVLIMDPYLLCR